MISSVNPLIVATQRSANVQWRLETLGVWVTRYGLVVVLLLIGFLKFTAAEAAGIQPLVAHSPLLSWIYLFLSVQGVSNLIGAIEIAVARKGSPAGAALPNSSATHTSSVASQKFRE